MKNSKKDQAAANIILQQLGGRSFLIMTGAKELLNMGDGLKMKLPRNASGCTYLYIQIMQDDTYTVTFANIRKYEWKVKQVFENVYPDNMVRIFEETTEMYTKM